MRRAPGRRPIRRERTTSDVRMNPILFRADSDVGYRRFTNHGEAQGNRTARILGAQKALSPIKDVSNVPSHGETTLSRSRGRNPGEDPTPW